MSFQSPLLLLGLAALPLLALLYVLSQRRRRAYAVRFTNLELLGQVMGKGPGFRRHVTAILFLVGVAGLLLAMARPVAAIAVPRDRASVMLAIDVSGSMTATDVTPTRLDAARSAARSLVDALPGQSQVGLVSFSSRANVIVPLTGDRQTLLDGLDTLRARGSTAIGDAIDLSVQQLQSQPKDQAGRTPPSMIVLLTDGGNNAGVSPQDAAGRANAAGIRVQPIGIGSRGGPVFVSGQEIGGVDEQLLQQIASQTRGTYHYAGSAGELRSIYSSLGSTFGWTYQRVDLTVPVLAAGTVIVVVGGLFSLRWFRLLP